MKTDNFDEAFRRKVEGLNPPFRDDEIDRIQGFVNRHIPLSFWQRFGHIFTYSIGTVIIVSLLITTIYQANENKILLNKISNLNTKLEQKQVAVAVDNIPKSISIEKTDTVYVIKHIAKEIPVIEEINSPNHSIAQLSEVVTAPDVSAPFFEGSISLNSLKTKKNSVQEVSNLTNAAKPNDVATANKQPKVSLPNAIKIVVLPTDEQQVGNLSDNAKSIEDVAKESIILSQLNTLKPSGTSDLKEMSNLSNLIKSNPSVESKFSGIVGQVGNLSDKSFQENNNKTLTISDLKRKIFNLVDSKFTFDLSSRKLHLPNYFAKTKKHDLFKFSGIVAPNLKYRIGFGANADFGQVGISVLTDILFAKHWSITSGVNMAFLGYERFGDEDDFKRKTAKDFRKEYPLNIPLTNPIENIEAHQVLFRVPIYLNYRLSLRSNYTVLFSTGTDLDFHLKQFTSYSHNDLIRNDKLEGLKEKVPVTPFNNWMISTGIEKRWKYFSVQFSPYLSTQITRVSYRKEDFIFGLKINSFYRLSK